MARLQREKEEMFVNEMPDVCSTVEPFSTAIFLDNHFLGSGTFISWDNEFGILTAEHVTNNPDSPKRRFLFAPGSEQRMQLTVAPHAHCLEFEVRYLQNVTLGKRLSDEMGPDLSVIILPESPQLSAIRAKKSFWSLTVMAKRKMATALDDRSVTVIAGHLAEEQKVFLGKRPRTLSRSVPGLAAITSQCNYFERDGFDYIEIGSEKGPGAEAPETFGGFSGGGLWRVRLRFTIDQNQARSELIPYLAGVIYWQSPEREGCRTLRAHGPKTLYQALLAKLIGLRGTGLNRRGSATR